MRAILQAATALQLHALSFREVVTLGQRPRALRGYRCGICLVVPQPPNFPFAAADHRAGELPRQLPKQLACGEKQGQNHLPGNELPSPGVFSPGTKRCRTVALVHGRWRDRPYGGSAGWKTLRDVGRSCGNHYEAEYRLDDAAERQVKKETGNLTELTQEQSGKQDGRCISGSAGSGCHKQIVQRKKMRRMCHLYTECCSKRCCCYSAYLKLLYSPCPPLAGRSPH